MVTIGGDMLVEIRMTALSESSSGSILTFQKFMTLVINGGTGIVVVVVVVWPAVTVEM